MAEEWWSVGPEDVTTLIAGIALAVLAVLVFAAQPTRRMNRSFAALLMFQSLMFLLLAINSRVASLPGRLRPYAMIAIPFAMLYVAYQILACYRASPLGKVRAGIVLAILTLIGGTFEALYFFDHSWVARPVPGEPGSFSSGPLDIFAELGFFTSALLALLFAFALRNSRLGLARRSLWQAMAAFALVPAYIAGFMLFVNLPDVLLDGRPLDDAYPPVQSALLAAALGVVAACQVVLWRAPSNFRVEAKRFGSLYASAFGTGIVTSMVVAFEPIDLWYLPHFAVYGLWSLASTALLAAPILRDHILDVDFRVEWTFRNGFVVTTVAATFFVVMQIAANWLTQFAGLTTGGIAAILVLFAMHPLQRLTDRLAAHTLPRGQPLKAMDRDERRKLYTEQAQIAWSDGALTSKERVQLDQLQRRLGLDEGDALHLERGIVSL